MKSAVAAAFLAVTGASVEAQTDLLFGKVGEWDILLDQSVSGGCYAIGSWNSGTVLRIGLREEDQGFYILLGNRDWASLEDGEAYDLKVKFGIAVAWDVTATGTRIGEDDQVYLLATSDAPEFLEEFQAALNMAISYKDRQVDNLRLNGSRRAWRTVEECRAKGPGAAPATTRAVDPFAE